MCELLALSFNKPVNASLSFRGFRNRGKYNRDGWGYAYYPDNAAQVIKEPISSASSDLSRFIVDYHRIKSKIYISHVRLASAGSVSFCNTHPFNRELFGKEYVFAHNGTLRGFDLSSRYYKPIGQTDSEQAFCFIIEQIRKKKIQKWNQKNLDFLESVLTEINEYGNFNCLMSDGEYLFCYYDKNSYNGLYFVERKAPFDRIRLLDEDFEINLSKQKSPDQRGFIIATEPLTNENWEEFNPGLLTVFKDGEIIR
jgi:glutamine amidotransferase